MRRILPLLVLVLGAALAPAAAPAVAQDIAGIYDAQGHNPGGGGAYKAVVQIVPFGSAHAILWKLGAGKGNEGLAIRQGNVLGAGYTAGKIPFGLVVYRVAGGVLDGEWISSGDPKAELGRETLEGPATLGGNYKITLGQNRDGTTNYTGEVIIKPDGDTYLLAWMVPKLAYVGRGVMIGDVLVVAYGRSQDPKKLPGVVAYKIDNADTLSGVWATPGAKLTGTETLKRRP
ncbi:hypothetical protein [Dongia sedimenti]|uniref:Uncharacterized protein n=1 Tax=Dongia sedimenti TaxID=3064282 RepID=A0ABU0YMS7_9PROT|nr:hypothetical protein [Rhodospirillaceae bacterium R-7]